MEPTVEGPNSHLPATCNTQHFSCIFWGFGVGNNVTSTYGFMVMGGGGVWVVLQLLVLSGEVGEGC